MIEVAPVLDAAERSRVCETVLRALPQWFGIEEAIRHYVRDVAALPTFAVYVAGEPLGFVSVKAHTPYAAELYVLGVLAEHHRSGIGRALVAAAEEQARCLGAEFLQVKTLGPSNPDEHYARTRYFYEALGFRPLEELHGLWSEGNPCLIMVKRL